MNRVMLAVLLCLSLWAPRLEAHGGGDDRGRDRRDDHNKGRDEDRVTLCHRDDDDDEDSKEQEIEFRLKSVRASAVRGHLGHGDGVPNGPVPGISGATFDARCGIIPPPTTTTTTSTVPTTSTSTSTSTSVPPTEGTTTSTTTNTPATTTSSTTLTPKPQVLPIVDAGPDRIVTVGTSQHFHPDATTTYDPDGVIIYWYWNFGDGHAVVSDSNGGHIDHTYETTGTFRVEFMVTDNDGWQSSDFLTVTVVP